MGAAGGTKSSFWLKPSFVLPSLFLRSSFVLASFLKTPPISGRAIFEKLRPKQKCLAEGSARHLHWADVGSTSATWLS
jgi:hypothetical protein